MPRVYTVEFENATIANASGDYDLFEITPADDKPIEIIGLSLDCTSELGDAQEEHLRLRIIRGHTTSGSGGSAPTPVPVCPSDAASGFTAETVNTTIASVGSTVNVFSDGMNVRAGYQMAWDPGKGPMASQGNTTIVVRMLNTVTDDLSLNGTLTVIEYP